jgi:serine/threonine protein kinase
MDPREPCPDEAVLRRHAEGGLSGAEEEALIAHLDTCEVCQQTLELLAAGGQSLLDAARQVGQEEGPSEARPGPPGTRGEPPLDFLGPPTSPQSLGTLGHYEVLGVIGRGGMGLVLQATDPALGRTVAIKVMAPQLAANPEARRRFAREARAAASVVHEHVITIHAVEESGGVPYLVMEYVAGQSLEQRLSGGVRLEVGEAVRIGLETAEGLAAAHGQGLIHRDVKPANILIEEGSGRVKLTDFGLARAAGDVALTRSGTVAGTPRYMAPEQATGDPVDHRGDVYSLGVTLYEALTGRAAFAGESALEVMRRVVSEEPSPPCRLNPGVPLDLETVVLKAMAKVPAERYAGAQEMADDLRRVGEDRPIRARRPTLWQRLVKWSRRNRPLVVLSAAAAVAVLVVSTVALAVSNVRINGALDSEREAREALGKALKREFKAKDALEKALGDRTRALGAEIKAKDALAEALEREKDTVYLSQVRLADWEWWANNVRRAEQLLEACSRERRGWEWHYLRRRCQIPTASLTGNDYDLSVEPTIRPDGRLAVSIFRRSREGDVLRLFDPETGKVVRILPSPGICNGQIRFSPDGERLAAAGYRRSDNRMTVDVWDYENGRKIVTLEMGLTEAEEVALSPGGRYVACKGPRGVTVWDGATGSRIHKVGGVGQIPSGGLAFSHDGKLLAAGFFGGVLLVESATGKVVCRQSGLSHKVSALAFSPDRLLLAAGQYDGSVRIWRVGTDQPCMILTGHTEIVRGLAFAHRAGWLATGSLDRTARIWAIGSGREHRRLRYPSSGVTSLAFLRGDTRLVAGTMDGKVRLWDYADAQDTRVLCALHVPLSGVAYSPDGRRLALSVRGGWTTPERSSFGM